MSIAIGLVFLGLELVCVLFIFLAIVRAGFARLTSAIGVARDGFPPGTTVPSWRLPDAEGHEHATPAKDQWQFLIFADQSLASFPEVIAGMHQLAQKVQELEVLVISQEPRHDCKATAQLLELQVPIVPVEPAFYERFRVRVMPFAMLLDPQGIVRWVGLVNTEAQLVHAWQMSHVDVNEGKTFQEV